MRVNFQTSMSTAEEIFVVVNERDEVIGQKPRGDAYPADFAIRLGDLRPERTIWWLSGAGS